MTEFINNVRALTGDDDDSTSYTFTDEQITALENLFKGSAHLAAASLLERVAVTEALLIKYVRTYDATIDGTKAAEIVLKRAKALREEYSLFIAEEDFAFEIVDFDAGNPYEYSERVL